MLRLPFLFIILWLTMPCIAQDSKKNEPIDASEQEIMAALDSLWVSYLVQKQQAKLDLPESTSNEKIPRFSDSVLIYRLKNLNSYIPLDFNDKTRRYIEVYTVDKREIVPAMLSLSNYYFPIFEAELDKQNMPLELRYVPVIESALKPHAVSRSGAVGLWQFMYWTAKYNHLHIDSYVDERRDPRASTVAACQYLKHLHGMYNDWLLAIAAYNCGPGNVNKALRKAGGKGNFWDIYQYLPSETRGYVPAFVAASYVFAYHKEHQIFPALIDVPIAIDTVIVERKLWLSDLANELNLDKNLVYELNPHFKKGIVPASSSRPYAIALPMKKCLVFCSHAERLYTRYDSLENTRSNEPQMGFSPATGAVSTEGKLRLVYTVKSGDNLGYIASWYNTSVSSLKHWNGLHSNNIRVGQKVVVYVSEDKLSHYQKVDQMSFAEKNGGASLEQSTASQNANSYLFYTFKSGDSLWNVIQNYPGNTVSEVMTMNNISNAKGIKPGTVIKLNKNS